MITHISCAPFFPIWVFRSKNGAFSRYMVPAKDHPGQSSLLYMLMEKQQGLVLLTGIVNDPAQTDAAAAPAQLQLRPE